MSKTLIQGDTTEAEGTICVALTVPEDLIFFQGHYENGPVMAAAVQLDVMLLPQVRRLWPELGPFRKATRVKFKRPIGPKDPLQLELRADGPKIAFRVLRASEVCALGTLHFGDGSVS